MKDKIHTKNWMQSGLMENQFLQEYSPNRQHFSCSSQLSEQDKWKDSSFMDYEVRPQEYTSVTVPNLNCSSSIFGDTNDYIQIPNKMDAHSNSLLQDSQNSKWDPDTMLKNLSFLEVKIHQLQDMVHFIVGQRYQVGERPDEVTAQQRQLISADFTAIIVQLISTAGSLLPSVSQNIPTSDQLDEVLHLPQNVSSTVVQPHCNGGIDFPELPKQTDTAIKNQVDGQNDMVEEHEMKDEEDVEEGEHLPPGSYEILQLEKEEILAPHTHFCTICGKGFKRDANLRMHMRGHGDEYKSPAALAKPNKECTQEPMLIKRYSCPYSGCKRNKEHKKFQPLKTMLCVKNHYKRSHCDKSFICSRCNNKKFSVIADLKTHEKHCGRDKWLCSCGTTFSRKDKLFGHITLFQGHTPAIPPDEKNVVDADLNERSNAPKVMGIEFDCSSNTSISNQNMMEYKANLDDPCACLSPLSYDPCNFNCFEEFPRSTFEDSESSFCFTIPRSFGYDQKNEGRD